MDDINIIDSMLDTRDGLKYLEELEKEFPGVLKKFREFWDTAVWNNEDRMPKADTLEQLINEAAIIFGALEKRHRDLGIEGHRVVYYAYLHLFHMLDTSRRLQKHHERGSIKYQLFMAIWAEAPRNLLNAITNWYFANYPEG